MNGWLSPEGKFYKCEYGGHRELAEEIRFGKGADVPCDENGWPRNAELELEKLGWVKIWFNVRSQKVLHDLFDDMTQAQINFLWDRGIWDGFDPPRKIGDIKIPI